MNSAMALAGIILGIGMIVFSKAFARLTIHSQNRTWGFHFGRSEEQFTRVFAIIAGIAFAVFGILVIAHVLPMKE